MTEIQPLTPRERLVDRLRTRYEGQGMSHDTAIHKAVEATEAFYAEDQHHPQFFIASYEATQVMLDVIPAFATSIRAAVEAVSAQASTLLDATNTYIDMIKHAKVDAEPAAGQVVSFDASGIPRDLEPSTDLYGAVTSIEVHPPDPACVFHGRTYDQHDFTYGDHCRRCGTPKNQGLRIVSTDNVIGEMLSTEAPE